jgi:putative heme-binding domain-containing protein
MDPRSALPTLAALLLAFAPAASVAQQHDENPFTSEADLREGADLYRQNCAVCHGVDGQSGQGARLAVRQLRHASTDRQLFRVIRNGIPGTEMPVLGMDEERVWKIVHFVRSLQKGAEAACEASPGDPRAGAAVFGRSGCSDCHTAGASGGRLGPDLSDVSLNHSRERLREILLATERRPDKRYRPVRIVSGAETVDGILLNEDGYRIHVFTRGERFRSFEKRAADSIERSSKSLMPVFAGVLSDEEVEDLLSYLCTLRGTK